MQQKYGKYLVLEILFIIISILVVLYMKDAGLLIFIKGLLLTISFSVFLKILLIQNKYPFSNFLIGENKTYSLSRLQFVLWVLTIVSFQVGIIFYLIRTKHFHLYEIVFAPNILWILAASFGTAIGIKGIAISQKNSKTLKIKSKSISDLIVGDNGLDFTRFQMLIWTSIALFVFSINSISYLESLKIQINYQNNLEQILETNNRLIEQIAFDRNVNEDTVKLEPILVSTINQLLQKTIDQGTARGQNDIRFINAAKELSTAYQNLEISIKDSALTEMIFEANNSLRAITNDNNAICKSYFTESENDSSESRLPDISITFLILMGLIEGTYIGKKLLPKQNTETTNEIDNNSFTPVTEPGRAEYGKIKNDYYELRLKEAFEIAKKKYLRKSFVTGVDIGFKYKDQKKLDEKVLRIHVKKKYNKSFLQYDELIEKQINGVPTDVLESNFKNYTTDKTDLQKKSGILRPGLSIGYENQTGTLGLIVIRKGENKKYVLSNYHVLKSKIVLQPSVEDGGSLKTINGRHADEIANITRNSDWFNNELGDIAIAEIVNERNGISNEIPELNIRIKGTRLANEKDRVQKIGRSTGITTGFVDGVGEYKLPNDDTFSYKSFMVRPEDDKEITKKGDSGALFFDPETSEGIGIHFAGSDDEKGNYALACHLPLILKKLNCEIL